MLPNPQKHDASGAFLLRREAGKWLRERREACGLSQRQLATAVGLDCYTIISQVESGSGRISHDKYRIWATALGMDALTFTLALLRYYDPLIFGIISPAIEHKRTSE